MSTSDASPLSSIPVSSPGCVGCRQPGEPIDISFAFQPIVDVQRRSVFAYEALVRGPNGESAGSVLSKVDEANRYEFDQRCRTTAIAQAAALKLDAYLSINFMPNAVYRPEACIRTTLAAAAEFGFPLEHIIFETLEGEDIHDRAHLVNIFQAYKQFGFKTAIDDFGSGYSSLSLLADFQPDFIKLDMSLVRGIDSHRARQRIVSSVANLCNDLNVQIIAEGVETQGERDYFDSLGIALMQGYWFAKPAFRALPEVDANAWVPPSPAGG